MSTQGLASPIRLFSVSVQWLIQIILLCGLLFSMQVNAAVDVKAEAITVSDEMIATQRADKRSPPVDKAHVADNAALNIPESTDSPIPSPAPLLVKTSPIIGC